MLDLLLSFVTGGNGIIAGLAAILALVTAAYVKGRSSANTAHTAKEAADNARQLKEIAAASNARNSVKSTDSVSDDKYRRD